MQRATLDACALYSSTARDLLLYFATVKMYKPFWNAEIHKEWIGSLASTRKELNRADLERMSVAMNTDFPDAMISGLSRLIKGLTLPDMQDRHVLATAIVSESDVVVTWNVKDFPKTYLKRFGITAITPDEFLLRMIGGRAGKFEMFVDELVSLSDPPVTPAELLQRMEKCHLKKTAGKLLQMMKEKAIDIGHYLKEITDDPEKGKALVAKRAQELLYPCEPTVRQFWTFETVSEKVNHQQPAVNAG
ncbi:PIN domain-containing protein [Terrimonas sp. NA20]|uniref:PIN domain-containing protein n=1 Tax=Terrimonas ginsenosidimutans TaxID=2908004 RepID=A0ABS9KUH2_9BACT|nr:PIN domain-containing protein [Terrimonas ginsenosidimutans]MCG2615956.1 PIN domain-containing protein [Terrimonas ginsenosidimutans]